MQRRRWGGGHAQGRVQGLRNCYSFCVLSPNIRNGLVGFFVFLFRNGGCSPSLCIQRMHTAVFINNKRKQKPQSRTKRYINQPEATVQANIATPTSSMKGVDRSEPHALTSRTNAHHLNPVASPCRPTASWEHQPVQPTFDAHHMRTLKAAAAVFHRSIFRSDQSNDLARPAIDAATATDNTPTLRESIIARPSPKPCGATLPRLAAKDAVDSNRTTSRLLPASRVPK